MKNWVRVIALSLVLAMVLGVSAAYADAYTVPKTLKDVTGLPENPDVPAMKTKNDGKTETVTVDGQLASLSAVWGDETAPLTLNNGSVSFDITGHNTQQGMEGKYRRDCYDYSWYEDRDYYNEHKDKYWQNSFYKFDLPDGGLHFVDTYSPLIYEGSGYLVRTPFVFTEEDEDGETYKDWSWKESFVGSDISDKNKEKLVEGIKATTEAVNAELDIEIDPEELVTALENGIVVINNREEWFSFWAKDLNGYGKAFEGKTANGVTVGYNRKGEACEKIIEMPAGTDFFASETAPSKVTVTWQSGKSNENKTVWYVSNIAQEYANETVTARFAQNGKNIGIKKEAK